MSVQTLASNGQFNNQGVLAGNLNGTPALIGFPETPTADSQGMYQHLGISGEIGLSTNFLNVSGEETGGFNFWTSNSTTAPDKIMNLSTEGIQTTKQLKLNDGYYYTHVLTPTTTNIRDDVEFNVNSQNERRIILGNDILNTQIGLFQEAYPFFNNTDKDGNHSRLTSTDLTFNDVSVLDAINTIKTQIVVPQLTFPSPAIYADSVSPPTSNITWQNNYAVFGWYFKNTTGSKINYYFPPQPNMTVGDIKGIYFQMFSNCATLVDLPYVIIYTVPTGNNDYRPWFHSSCAYVPTANTSSPNQSAQCYANIKNLSFTPNSFGIQNQIPMVASNDDNPKGDYQDNQQVLFWSFQTNSGSQNNNVEISLLKLGIITTFSQEYLFQL